MTTARIAASAVLAASLMIGMSGCAFFSQQATLIHYDPSDGVGTSVGDVAVRNALLLTQDGQTANLLVNFINQGDSTIVLELQYKSSAGTVTKAIDLEPGQVQSYGGTEDSQFPLDDINTKPGGLLPLWVQYGTHTGEQLLVPVLDGTWQTYKGLTPTASPTPTNTLPVVTPPPAAPSVTPTPKP